MTLKLNTWFQCIDFKIIFECNISNDERICKQQKEDCISQVPQLNSRQDARSPLVRNSHEKPKRRRSRSQVVFNISRTSIS